MHAACAAEFAGGYMCHYTEYTLATSRTLVPAAGAWIDRSVDIDGRVGSVGATQFGRYLGGGSCDGWTGSGSDNGTHLIEGGLVSFSPCDDARPIACCNGTQRVAFAGFAGPRVGGVTGGRPGMHGVCDDAFTGSRLCHYAEYIRTRDGTPVPIEGAWLDRSAEYGGSVRGNGHPQLGRYLGGGSCSAWTNSTAAGDNGTHLTSGAANVSFSSCDNLKYVACCYGP